MTNQEVRFKCMEYFIGKEFTRYDCCAADFLKNENKVVLADDADADLLSMVCFGAGAVIKAKKEIFEWCKRFASVQEGFRCFDLQQVVLLGQVFRNYNLFVQGGHGMLPDVSRQFTVTCDCAEIRVFEADKKEKMFGYIDEKEWHMCRPNAETALIVVAFSGNKIVGMATADRESELLWSIDAEVLPAYRHKGIAVALTNTITNRIMARDGIPFATGAWSNTASRATLHACGYYQAWTMLSSCEKDWAKAGSLAE